MSIIGQKILIGLDNITKFIPIISTAGSLVNFFQKHVIMRAIDVQKTDNLYVKHIKNQSNWVSVALLIPILGNLGYTVYKIVIFFKKKEIQAEKDIEKVAPEKSTPILTQEKKAPKNLTFKSFMGEEILHEGMELINLMKTYIKLAEVPESEKDKINAIKEVLKTMKNICQLAESDPGLKVTAIYCEGQLSGIMCTNYDFQTSRFTLNDMVTAPWNVGPQLEINLNEKTFNTPAPRYGIGTLLLNKAIELAKENKCSVIRLMSLNQESTSFYLKNGFKETGTAYPLAMEKEIEI